MDKQTIDYVCYVYFGENYVLRFSGMIVPYQKPITMYAYERISNGPKPDWRKDNLTSKQKKTGDFNLNLFNRSSTNLFNPSSIYMGMSNVLSQLLQSTEK